MRSSKNRSRSKNNRNRTVGNVVNRVFDSSGPEGKVRGTPQQIIEKYNQLARDAQLSNDRVAAENFQQHAEHYARMLAEAQREMDQRREQQEREQRDRQQHREEQNAEGAAEQNSGDTAAVAAAEESGLVETPEDQQPKRRAPRPRKPRAKSPEGEQPQLHSTPETPEAAE
ncbi:MAG: DUF4167 domain-containing protein [Paracoccaceae bacterium]|nr:DUF4167 domain-containing protein [Paracoccaceae bacterium]